MEIRKLNRNVKPKEERIRYHDIQHRTCLAHHQNDKFTHSRCTSYYVYIYVFGLNPLNAIYESIETKKLKELFSE